MAHAPHTPSPRCKLLPPRFVFIGVALYVFLFGLSGCSRSTSAPNGNASGSATVTVTSSGGSAPANANSTTASAHNAAASSNRAALPASLREAPLETLDGKTFKLSDYAGKVVLINFWATWCGPCRMEIPELVKINGEYKDKGFELVGLTMKENEPNPEDVADFVSAERVNYRIGWASMDFAEPFMMQPPNPGSIPQSFLISRDGRLLKHFAGFSPDSTPGRLRQAIKQALSDKSGA